MVRCAAALSLVPALGLALGLTLAAAPVRADSPHLAEARRAVEAVDYDAARRLLVDALRDGGNSPAAMREIYRLSARAAVVLDQRELAEQFYRRWLAIDPDAALPDDTAPKLREPFVAAQAYIAAHGRLRATARRTPAGKIDVELIADPLAMAHAAAALDPAGSRDAAPATASSREPARRPPAVFGAERRVRLAEAPRVAILDDRGNHLLELEPTAAVATAPAADAPAAAVPATAAPAAAAPAPSATPATAPPPETPAEDRRPRIRRWLTWAIPTGVFALGAAGFGIAAIVSYGNARTITASSGGYYLSDAQDSVRRGRTFVWVTIGAGAATVACAIPAAIYLARDLRRPRVVAAPTVAPGALGLVLVGRF
jgi:hypothetical protein